MKTGGGLLSLAGGAFQEPTLLFWRRADVDGARSGHAGARSQALKGGSPWNLQNMQGEVTYPGHTGLGNGKGQDGL